MISALLLLSLFDTTIFLRKHTRIKQLLSATTGYQAQLHGTEAVVPLPDNRSIPVTLSKESTADQKVLEEKLHKAVQIAQQKLNHKL